MYIGDTYYNYVMDAQSHALPRTLYIRIMRRVFWHIMRRVMLDISEWKLPNSMGFLRIAKRRARPTSDALKERYRNNGIIMTYPELTGGYYFHYYWDKLSRSTKISHKEWFSFIPCEDQRTMTIGRRGLNRHVVDLAMDTDKPNYNLVNKSRRNIR